MISRSRSHLKGGRGKLTSILLASGLSIFAYTAPATAWSLKEAAAPYKGTSITILDETTPLQEAMAKLVPDFTKETGINVKYELLNHFDVIGKGQADMVSGKGTYDGVMLHSFQMGPMLDAGVVRPIDDFMGNKKLADPNIDLADLISSPYKSTSVFKGKNYGFLSWNYNSVYWARNDLLSHPGEKKAFKSKYGYDLAPAKTMQQMADIAEFFTRKKGDSLAGQKLESDFYGIVMEGIKGGTTFPGVWYNFLKNWGGGLVDGSGKPAFNTAENIAALKFWAGLWKYSPPGQAEYSLIDVPTVMGNGIAAQTIAWSDFVFGIDVPGKSKFAGKFVYGGIPKNTGYTGKGSSNGAPSIIVVSEASKNAEQTFLFMQWMASKEVQEKLFNAVGGGVPLRDSTFEMGVVKNSSNPTLYTAMRDSLAVTEGKPKMPQFFELYDELGAIVQNIGLGTISPEEGVKIGQAKMEKICKNCLL